MQTAGKNQPVSRFLLYLGGKCLDLYKIFRVSLTVISHSIEVEIKYLLLVLIRKHFIRCLSSIVKPIICKLRHWQQYLIFTS